MKYSAIAATASDARAQIPHKGELHISAVFYVKGRPDVREWVFTTVLS